MNDSFGLLKPDCVKRNIEKKLLKIIESNGLEIVIAKRVRLTKREVDIIWASCMEESFYDDLLKFSLSADCVIFIAKGNNAIDNLNYLVGHYDPINAESHTIRHQFGKTTMENVIHSTSNKETFYKEALLFFTQSELRKILLS